MYLMYVDESGDDGLNSSPTNYFVLSALIIHEDSWQNVLDDLIAFRKGLKDKYGLYLNEEIHAGAFITGSSGLKNMIARNDKLSILKDCLRWLNARNDISIITIRCNKKTHKSTNGVFELTWNRLIQRFDNTLSFRNFPGGFDGKGMIISDNTQGQKLRTLLRRMRRQNYVPHQSTMGLGPRNVTLRAVIEDPYMKDSADSYFHQMADVVAYFARQYYEPNKYVRKKGARTFYTTFLPNVVNPHATRYNTPGKIVEV